MNPDAVASCICAANWMSWPECSVQCIVACALLAGKARNEVHAVRSQLPMPDFLFRANARQNVVHLECNDARDVRYWLGDIFDEGAFHMGNSKNSRYFVFFA
eukprot:TRINITY_DN14531_c0_g1_i1.p1 TRINITY_DN14531_c0_g1~~TRINITY_DN14531_c0_g1_i1.p1  ORF type:complete len:102 (-),score=9.79 TRINITY_DN14531_c0_g1_i1:32-337(-)